MSLVIKLGPMFSGKSTWLNKELTKLSDGGFKVVKIIHIDDSRYDNISGSYHHSSFYELNDKITVIKTPTLLNLNLDYFEIIGIDESNFFEDLKLFVIKELKNNKNLKVVGLDGDYKQEKFGQLLDIIPYANKITKLTSLCELCIQNHIPNQNINLNNFTAYYTKKKINNNIQKEVGDKNLYTPVCFYHLNN